LSRDFFDTRFRAADETNSANTSSRTRAATNKDTTRKRRGDVARSGAATGIVLETLCTLSFRDQCKDFSSAHGITRLHKATSKAVVSAKSSSPYPRSHATTVHHGDRRLLSKHVSLDFIFPQSVAPCCAVLSISLNLPMFV
jgi:hypothetical protein